MDEPTFSLSPIHSFQISVDCRHLSRKKGAFTLSKNNAEQYRLPSLAEISGETPFADVSIGWNQEGVELFIDVKASYKEVSYPEITRGDSIELFFDTRDVKTSGFNTRFCHHFFFLPEAVEGQQAGEITRFRTEDAHELCSSSDLIVKGHLKLFSYSLNIFIPSQCLHGYDPDQFDRLGFTYRINRFNGKPQHFSATSEEYQIEQQPSLWSSLKLIK